MKERVERKILKEIINLENPLFEMNSKADLNKWLESIKIPATLENRKIAKIFSMLFEREACLKGLNKKKYDIERLSGQSIRLLRGVYPVYTSSVVSENLAFYLYYQARLEKLVIFDQRHLDGKCGTDRYDFSHVPIELWNKMLLYSELLIHECNWISLKYKEVSQDLYRVKIDDFPVSFYIKKNTLRSISHKELLHFKNSLYDDWFSLVRKQYNLI